MGGGCFWNRNGGFRVETGGFGVRACKFLMKGIVRSWECVMDHLVM